MLVEIGKYNKKETYVPAQDKNRIFLDKHLGDITDTVTLPPFTYESLLRKARTIDVIWFNDRRMPTDLYEVEHTTDIKNSLSKFYELQDFYAKFYIVADKSRENEFLDKLNASIFNAISKRVRFLKYEQIVNVYEGLTKANTMKW